MIHENQENYYKSINESNNAGESTIFVKFMLNMFRDVLKEIVDNQNTHNNVGTNVGTITNVISSEIKLLELLKTNPNITINQLSSTLKLSTRQVERLISKLKKENKIIRIGATKNGSWKVL